VQIPVARRPRDGDPHCGGAPWGGPVEGRLSGRLNGKHAIVTGGNRGIGRAIVDRFAAEGAEVLVVGRNQKTIDETVGAIGAAGGTAWGYRADVTNADDLRRLVVEATIRWDRLDVLVNNAGIGYETPFLDIPEEQWDEVVATNLKAPFRLSQLVCREMAKTGGGCVVHIASIDASGGDGPYASYNASKAALLGLNRTMALELGPLGIRVNCVSPGFTHTDMTEEAVPAEVMDYLVNRFERVPMRRLVKPEEVAAACAYLASDDASGVTGIDLRVDCGLTANWFILETLEGAS
jgi:NAD(P)-dependent dehydrogenase (short-subunit alcohol dehydrogenase family)